MKKEFKIGLFAVVITVLAFFVLNYLRGEDIFNKENEYVSYYSDLEGLVASAPVYIKGYKAGKVAEVRYDSEKNRFDVVCSVSRDFSVPSDSRMTIYSVDIMGGKGVRIDLGKSSDVAADGDTLKPCFEAGLMDALSDEISPLMTKVTEMVDSLATTVSGFNSLLSDDNIRSLKSSIAHLNSIMYHLKSLASEIDGKSDEIAQMIDDISGFSADLGPVAEKVDSTVMLVNDFAERLGDADISGTVNSLKAILEDIDNPSGTVGKLLKDDAVYNSVDSLLSKINFLAEQIKENPKKYLKISVF